MSTLEVGVCADGVEALGVECEGEFVIVGGESTDELPEDDMTCELVDEDTVGCDRKIGKFSVEYTPDFLGRTDMTLSACRSFPQVRLGAQ